MHLILSYCTKRNKMNVTPPKVFAMLILFVLSSCIYGVDPTTPEDQGNNNGTILSTSFYSFQGEIGPASYNMNTNSNYGYAYENSAVPFAGGNFLKVGSFFAEPGANSQSLKLVFFKKAGSGYTAQEIHDMFTLDNKVFRIPDGNTDIGVYAEWVDENGKLWASYAGDQSVSDMRILARGPMEGVDNRFYVDTRFNCTVYDAVGSAKRISSARWKGSFRAFF